MSKLLHFFINNELINQNQHGFKKNKSTITALFEFLEIVLKGLDNHESIIALFVDLSNAFDCVDH